MAKSILQNTRNKLSGRLESAGRGLASLSLKVTGNEAYALQKKGKSQKSKPMKRVFAGDKFNELAQAVKSHNRTLMSQERLYVLWQSVLNTSRLTGDIAEIGVFKGGSSWFLAAASAELNAAPDAFYAIDTFEGHAEGTISEPDEYHAEGMFADTDYESVRHYLSAYDFINVCKGEFSSITDQLKSSSYRLVHIDTDLYQPTLDCFEYFLPKLQVGGIFIVDDYLGRKCPGVTQAVHEFIGQHPEFEVWFFHTEQIVLVHRNLND